MPGKVTLVRPSDGAVVTVPAENEATLVSLGYRRQGSGEALEQAATEAKQDYYGSGAQRVIAGAEGALAGATLGVSDWALEGLGADTSERAAANPGLRTVTEIGGSVATAALSGGAGLAGRVARVTPSGRLAAFTTRAAEARLGPGLAAKVAGGAAEGAVAGLGGELSRAALSGDDLTVERALAGVGLGAVFGAGAGVLAHGMDRAAAARARSVEEEVAESLGMGASRAADDAVPAPRAPDAAAEVDAPARAAAEVDVPGRGNPVPDEALGDFAAAADDVVRFADDLGPPPPPRFTGGRRTPRAGREGEGHMGVATEATDWNIAHGRAAKAWQDAKSSYDESLRQAMNGVEASRDATRAATNAQAQYRLRIEEAADMLGMERPKWTGPVGRVRIADDGAVGHPYVQRMEKVRGVAPDAHAELRRAAEILRSAPRDAKSLGAMSPEKLEELNAAVEAAVRAKVPAASAAQEALRRTTAGMAERAGVAAGGEGPGAGLRATWAAARSGSSEAKKRGLGKRFIERTLGLTAVDAAFGRRVGPNLARHAVTGVLFGAGGMALDAVKSAALRVAGTKAGAAAARVAGPRAWGLYRSLDGVQDPEGDLREAFRRRSEEVRELAGAARDRAFAGLSGALSEGQGDFAAGAYAAAVRAAEVLARRVPKDPPGTRWGAESMWEAPEEQVEVFAQEYGAVVSPLEYLGWAAENPTEALPSAVDALREAWPALYQDFRARALETVLAEDLSDRPAGEMQALAVLLDAPLTPTYTPEFIGAQAAMFAAPPAPPSSGPRDPGGRPPGNEQTASERLAAR